MESSAVRTRKSYFIILVYFSFLLLNIFIEKMSAYGYIQSLVFAVTFFFCNKMKDNIKNIALTLTLLVPVLLITKSGFLYFVNDCITLFLVLSCIAAFKHFNLTERQGKIVAATLLVYAVLFLVCTAFPSFYDDTEGRYKGLFHGGNSSSSVLMLIIAFILEYYKWKKIKWFVYTVSFACFLVAVFLCNTRSIFFVIPYLLWLYKENINFKKAWPILLVVVAAGSIYINRNSAEMSEDLRLTDEDASYLTRAYLYELEIEGISKNYYVLPHGFNACNSFIRNETGNDRYSPHNDLLAYWYDWGIIWFVVLVIFFVRIRLFVKSVDFVFGSILLFLFVLSCGLHNIMLHINIWIPLVLIMWRARIIHDNKKNLRICQ